MRRPVFRPSRITLATLLLVGAAVFAGCGDETPAAAPGAAPDPGPVTDFGPTPVPIDVSGAPAVVTPAPGSWHFRTDNAAPGESLAQWTEPGGTRVLQVVTFPTQQSTDPVAVLMQAVDRFFRGLGVEGFGLPSRKALRVWGAPAAEGTVNAALGGHRVDGSARLVLVRPDQWAFAVGIAPTDAPVAEKDAVHRFVHSLEPRSPRFYERRFRDEEALARVALQVGEEKALSNEDVAAVLLLLQAGADARLPLATQQTLREALLAHARASTPEGRSGYRDAAAAFPTWTKLDPAERAAGMRQLGARMLQGLFQRANQADPAAMRFANAWRYLGKLAMGTEEDGLNIGQVTNLTEMSAFLASIAFDGDVTGDPAVGTALRDRLREGLAARWAQLPAEERAALRRSGSQWAELRRAWDLATEEDRAAFRRAVVAELADPAEREIVSALDPGRPLLRWIEAQAGAQRAALLVERAFALTPGQRALLIGLLGVEPRSFALGW